MSPAKKYGKKLVAETLATDIFHHFHNAHTYIYYPPYTLAHAWKQVRVSLRSTPAKKALFSEKAQNNKTRHAEAGTKHVSSSAGENNTKFFAGK